MPDIDIDALCDEVQQLLSCGKSHRDVIAHEEDWDAMDKSVWVKYHSMLILRNGKIGDEYYLDWMLKKSRRFGLSPDTETIVREMCSDPYKVPQALLLLDLWTLEAVGI